MRILALYDDQMRCYYHALKDKHTILSVGWLDKTNEPDYRQADLSKPGVITKLIEEFKPDLILASPPCDSWSSMTQGLTSDGTYHISARYGRTENGHSLLDPLPFELYKTSNFSNIKRAHDKRKTYDKQLAKTLNGNATMKTLGEIFDSGIDYVIENPRLSRLFTAIDEYHQQPGYKNTINYSDYGGKCKKPTIFFSNKELEFNNQTPSDKSTLKKIKWDKETKTAIPVKERSEIPHSLIRAIIENFDKK